MKSRKFTRVALLRLTYQSSLRLDQGPSSAIHLVVETTSVAGESVTVCQSAIDDEDN